LEKTAVRGLPETLKESLAQKKDSQGGCIGKISQEGGMHADGMASGTRESHGLNRYNQLGPNLRSLGQKEGKRVVKR